jgi:hypothetical protein
MRILREIIFEAASVDSGTSYADQHGRPPSQMVTVCLSDEQVLALYLRIDEAQASVRQKEAGDE